PPPKTRKTNPTRINREACSASPAVLRERFRVPVASPVELCRRECREERADPEAPWDRRGAGHSDQAKALACRERADRASAQAGPAPRDLARVGSRAVLGLGPALDCAAARACRAAQD